MSPNKTHEEANIVIMPSKGHIPTVAKVLAVTAVLVGLIALATGADADAGCGDSDNTFCIAQHPSPTVAAAAEAGGGVYADAGLPFVIPGQLYSIGEVMTDAGVAPPEEWQMIWPGTPDGKRALVSVCLMGGSGSATVRWTEGAADLDPGDSITVYSSFVEIGNADFACPTPEELAERDVDGYTAAGDGLVHDLVLARTVYGTYTITLDLCD
jgi:hypothetical protein